MLTYLLILKKSPTFLEITYSRVWNKRTPLNKRSPLENLAKRIIVAPFLPYTMKSGIRPQPLEKSQKINKRRAMFIPDSRVSSLGHQASYQEVTGLSTGQNFAFFSSNFQNSSNFQTVLFFFFPKIFGNEIFITINLIIFKPPPVQF